MPMPMRSYVLPDKRFGDPCEERSAVELHIENTGLGKFGIELANNPQRLERSCDRYWLDLQQPMKCPVSDSWQQQVQKCLLDL